jgi:hypothetical protein
MLSLLPVTLLIASVSCFPFSKINYFVNTCTSHIEQELNISQGTAPDLKEPYSFG